MTSPNVLLVEDHPTWQRELSRLLRDSFDHVDVAATRESAWKLAQARSYEMMVIDLSLVARVRHKSVEPNKEGVALLARVRRSEGGSGVAIAIITGYPTTVAEIRDAFTEYEIDDFIEKSGWDPDHFVTRIRRARIRARIRNADRTARTRQRATITAASDRLISCELMGPQRGSFLLDPPLALNSDDFGTRADALNALVLAHKGDWRTAARALGSELYAALISNPDVAQTVFNAVQRSTSNNPAVVEIAGPASLLRVPFELANSGKDYLCFESIITRRVSVSGMASARGEAFHELVDRLVRTEQPLNMLLVGVNSDGQIPGVEEEVELVRTRAAKTLTSLGIPHSIEVLAGPRATYQNIRERLASGRLHVLHFAGHGRFDDVLPEISGIIVAAGNGGQLLSAADLKQLFTGSGVRLAFFSCCVGARTAQQVGRGDFHGTLDAIVRAEVPVAVGYRWVVPDGPAQDFALEFYDALWITLSPGTAMLHARVGATLITQAGRDNFLWAAPIMVCQTSP